MIFVDGTKSSGKVEHASWAEDSLPNVSQYTSGNYVKGCKIIGMTFTERSVGQWLLTVRVAVQKSVFPPERLSEFEACGGLFIAFEGGSSPSECLDKLDVAIGADDLKLRPDDFAGQKLGRGRKK